MGKTMDHEELYEAIRGKQPFVPVRITLSNGATYDVTHPEGIMIRESVAAIGVGNRIALVAIGHINEVLPQPAVTAN